MNKISSKAFSTKALKNLMVGNKETVYSLTVQYDDCFFLERFFLLRTILKMLVLTAIFFAALTQGRFSALSSVF